MQITIRVLDSGIGISPDEIANIFNLFWCSSTPGSKNLNQNGNGIGLYLCKQICQGLGGDISVTSEQGRGSQFKFSMIGYKQINEESSIGQTVQEKRHIIQ